MRKWVRTNVRWKIWNPWAALLGPSHCRHHLCLCGAAAYWWCGVCIFVSVWRAVKSTTGGHFLIAIICREKGNGADIKPSQAARHVSKFYRPTSPAEPPSSPYMMEEIIWVNPSIQCQWWVVVLFRTSLLSGCYMSLCGARWGAQVAYFARNEEGDAFPYLVGFMLPS